MNVNPKSIRYTRSDGQASAEYLVALGFVVFVFFAGSPSLIEQFISAFTEHFQRFTFILALP